MSLADLIVEFKESVRQRTRNLYPKIPADRIAFAPVEGALTLGQILHHLWMSEEGITNVLSRGSWDYFERRMSARLVDILEPIGSLHQELDNLERVHHQTIALIRSLPDDAFSRKHVNVQLKHKRTTRSFLMGLAEHEAHHRGQIAIYLRMLGDKAPSPYQGFR